MRCSVPSSSSSSSSVPVPVLLHALPVRNGALCRTRLRSVRRSGFGPDTEPRVARNQRLTDPGVPTVFPWTQTTSENQDARLIPTSSGEEEPTDRAVKTTGMSEGTGVLKSSEEVLVNARCLLELFRCCSVCLVECSVSTEGSPKLFSVTQDCQSCGHRRVWRSQPALTEQHADTFHTHNKKHEQSHQQKQKNREKSRDKERKISEEARRRERKISEEIQNHDGEISEEECNEEQKVNEEILIKVEQETGVTTSIAEGENMAESGEEDHEMAALLLPQRVRNKEVSMEVKEAILSLRKQEKSYREIAKTLGLSKSTVGYIMRKASSTGDLSNRKRSGRPRKTTAEDDQLILSIMTKNPRTTIQQIRNSLKELGRDVSTSTISRKLHSLNHTIESAFLRNLKINK